MPHSLPRLYQATEHIPSIGARKGDYVLDDGTRLCVMREAVRDGLVAAMPLLRPVTRPRLPKTA